MFEKARVQVPDMVKKRLEEVYKFNKSISQSRLEIISEKIRTLNKDRDNFREEQLSLNKIIDEISELLAENETYKELFALFEFHQNKLYDLRLRVKLEEKTDFQIEKINEIARNIKNKLFPILETEKEKYSHLIEKYYEYIKDFTNSIYEEKPVSNFGIKINKPDESKGAISFVMSIDQEGEGVIGSKKNIIDYLISNNTTKTQILVQDTSCFNGIDPRQVTAMIAKAGKQLYDKDKQFIVAINKYQITEEIEEIAILKDNIKLELSEEDRLFNIEF